MKSIFKQFRNKTENFLSKMASSFFKHSKGSMSGVGYGNFLNSRFKTYKDDIESLIYTYKTARSTKITQAERILYDLSRTNGIADRIINLPVNDAFKNGFKIESQQLSQDQKTDLQKIIETKGFVILIKDAISLSRTYGGSAVVVGQGKKTELGGTASYNDISFIAIPRYMAMAGKTPQDIETEIRNEIVLRPVLNNEYTTEYEKDNVIFFPGKGNTVDGIIDHYGWGFSVFENIIGALASYTQIIDAINNLIETSNMGIFKADRLKESINNNENAIGFIRQMLEDVDYQKDFKTYIIDKEDEYDFRSQNFSGLAEIIDTAKFNLSAHVGLPALYLFGQGSSAFGSGEDQIQTYISYITNEIYKKYEKGILQIIKKVCYLEFGFVPSDLEIMFNSVNTLRSAEETAKQQLQMQAIENLYTSGVITGDELRAKIDSIGLFEDALNIEETTPQSLFEDSKEDLDFNE